MVWEIKQSSKDIIEYIDNTLGEFNKSQVNYNSKMDFIPMNYYISDENDQVIAGINAFSCWQMIYLSEFYVEKNYRGQGIGSLLLNKVEQEGKQRGALISQTDSFDWQAKDFYLQHGYEVFGLIDNCPKGHKRYYLKKIL